MGGPERGGRRPAQPQRWYIGNVARVEGVLLGAEAEATTVGFGVGIARMFGDTFQLDLSLDSRRLNSRTDVTVGLGIATLL